MNKLDSIDNEFRFFKMERLAGDDEYIVEAVSAGSVVPLETISQGTKIDHFPFPPILFLLSLSLANPPHSPNQTALSPSISGPYTGTVGYTLNTRDWSTRSGHMKSSRTCLRA